jgi:hypothetical protein
LHAFSIRKERKKYGLRNLVEGVPLPCPVLLIDDLTSPQHNSFWHAIHVPKSEGLKSNGRGYVLVLKQDNRECTIGTSLRTVVIDCLFTLRDFSLTMEDFESEMARGGSAGHTGDG